MKEFKTYKPKPKDLTHEDLIASGDYALQYERVLGIQKELGFLAVQRASIDKKWDILQSQKLQIQIEWNRIDKK